MTPDSPPTPDLTAGPSLANPSGPPSGSAPPVSALESSRWQDELRDLGAAPWFASPAPWSVWLASLLLLYAWTHMDAIPSRWLLAVTGEAWLLAAGVPAGVRFWRKSEPTLYPRHGYPFFWVIVWLWGATAGFTGGYQSAALYIAFCMLASLSFLSMIARLKACALVAIVAFCLDPITRLLHFPPPDWLPNPSDGWNLAVYGAVLLTLLCHACLMREFLPVAGTYSFHETDPVQGYDGSLERLLCSILLRALKIYDADAACVVCLQQSDNPSHMRWRMSHSINWSATEKGEGRPAVPEWLSKHLLMAVERGSTEASRLGSGLGEYESADGPERAFSVLIFSVGPEIAPSARRLFVLVSKRFGAFWLTAITFRSFWWSVLVVLEWAAQISRWRRLLNDARDLESYERLLGDICTDLAPPAIQPLEAVLKIDPVGASGRLPDFPVSGDKTVFVSTAAVIGEDGYSRYRIALGILADRKALAAANDDINSAARSRIRRFMADLLGPLVQVLIDLHRHGRRGYKAPRGSATLRYTPKVRQKIDELRGKDWSDQDVEGFGFEIEAVDDLMKAWLPWLAKMDFKSQPHICWQSYLQPSREGSSMPGQSGACPGCPIIGQLQQYLHKTPSDDAEGYGGYWAPVPAPAPAGERRIMRHFYLACRLVRLPRSESILHIEEVVEDRTTRMETEGFAQWLQSTEAATAVRLERRANWNHPLLQRLADSAGRIFHADHILFIQLHGPRAGRYDASFRRGTLAPSKFSEFSFNAREWSVLQAMRAKKQSYSTYFMARECLFGQESRLAQLNQSPFDAAVIAGLRLMASRGRETGRAQEAVSSKLAPGFWMQADAPLGGSERIIVSPIPLSTLAMVICTGAPERWERRDLDKSEVLFPREEEMLSVHDMCVRLGNALNGLNLPSGVHLEINRQVLISYNHELTHVLGPLEDRAKSLNKFFDEGLKKWDASRRALQKVSLKVPKDPKDPKDPPESPELDLLDLWRMAIAKAVREVQFPSYEVIYAATEALCLAAANSERENHARWQTLARLGLDTTSLPHLEQLRQLSQPERDTVVECLASLAELAATTGSLNSITQHAGRVFYLAATGESQPRPVNIVTVVRDIYRGLSDLTPAFTVGVLVPRDLDVVLRENVFSMMLQILMKNAFAAVHANPPLKQPAIRIKAEMQAGRLILRVENQGTQIPDASRLFFRETTSTTEGQGVGLSDARNHAQINHGFLRYEYDQGWNCFVFTQDEPSA